MNRTFTADDRAAQERLDVYVARTIGVTRNAASQLLHNQAVTVNHHIERSSYLVKPGDNIVISAPKATTKPSVTVPSLPIIYEDTNLLVIDKPAGLASHPGVGSDGYATVADFARLHTTDPDPLRPGIVHRLDRNTSGLMIIAKTIAAKEALQQLFRDHRVIKTYTLLANGRVKPVEAIIKLPLDRDPTNPLRRAVVTGGKPAVTHYHTIRSYPGFSLIAAQPQTGRTHQLRVHFAAIGHSIVGDTMYGQGRQNSNLTRQFLHASRLQFTNLAGQALDLHSPLPPELSAILNRLDGEASV